MKKTLSMITLAVLTVGLLASCAKINERLDDLEKKVGGLENEEIATIESQVSSIESSISDLKSIRDKVQAMSDPATGLGKRIKELEAFASDVKKNYATQDWAKTTLVTMDEYEKTCDTVAKIAAKVEGFDSDIKACADSLKGWVNEKFGGYYDIATIDAKLAELQEQVDGVDSLSAELAKTREEIDTAKVAIRAEYRAAITSAIETSEGKLTQALRDSIDSVNATISTLTGRVETLETKVEALTGKVDSLENVIQTVTIVPAFSDGSVEVKDDTLFIDCVITPAEVVKALDTADFTILLNKVLTKAIVLDTVPTDSIKVFTKDTLNGTVSIKAHIKETLDGLGNNSLTVAVNVKKAKSDYTTEFVPVYAAPSGPEYVVMKMGSDQSKSLKWATMNLGATTVAGSGETCFGDYYAWGAIEPYYATRTWDSSSKTWIFNTWNNNEESGYGWESYCNGSSSFVEWSPAPYDGTTYNLTTEYDVVQRKVGNGWRMPTSEEFQALYDACGGENEEVTGPLSSANPEKGIYSVSADQTYISDYNGVAGLLFCDGTNKLFFPFTGFASTTAIMEPTSGGCWSSNYFQNKNAYHISFNSAEVYPQFDYFRYHGLTVRPVKDID